MENIKKYISQIVAFALGFALAFVFVSFYKKPAQDSATEQEVDQALDMEKMMQEAQEQAQKEKEIIANEAVLAQNASTTDEANFDYIKVSDQKAGKEVNVAYAKADFPFWLVVHAEKDGKIWNALGARRKEAGEYSGVIVPLLASTKSGGKYWVVLYKDNGDKKFDLKDDFPVKRSDGGFIMVDFKAL